MSRKRFQARAKTVQKLGRDGLVEQNKATGEERRISQRTADISFGPDRTTEQQAGHHAAQRGGDPAAPAKKRAKQSRPVQQTAEEAVYAAQAPAVTQEAPVWDTSTTYAPAPDAPATDAPSMRMAADAPLMGTAAPDACTPSTPLVSPPQRTQSSREKFKRKQVARHTPDTATQEDRPMRTAGDAPLQNRPPGAEQPPPAHRPPGGEQQSPVYRPPRPVEGGGRLQYKETDAAPARDGQHPAGTGERMPQQQVRRFAPDAAQPAAATEQRSSRLMPGSGERLHFENAAEPTVPGLESEAHEKAKRAIKKRQVMDHAAEAAQPEDSRRAEPPAPVEGELDTRQWASTQLDSKAPELSAVPEDWAAHGEMQTRHFAPDAAQPAAVEPRPSRLMPDGGGRLHFERAAEPAVPGSDTEAHERAKRAIKKRQVMDYAADAAKPKDSQWVEPPTPGEGELDTRQWASTQPGFKAPEPPAVSDERAAEPRPSRLMPDGGGRLHFERAAEPAVPVSETEAHEKAKRAIKKRQVMDYAADAAKLKDSQQAKAPDFSGAEADTRQLRASVQPEPKAPEFFTVPNDRKEYKKWQAARHAAYSVAPISLERRRLQFRDTPPPPVDHAPTPEPKEATPPPIVDPPPISAPKEDAPPPDRTYEKAVRRVERAEQQVEQARAELPAKRRLSFKPEVDSETGKSRRRLHFEEEVLPEYRMPSLPARAGGMVKTAEVMKLHSKIHESERDNVAVEATHKGELLAEQGVGRALRWQRDRRRSRPYRVLRQAERRAAKENAKLAWQTALRDHPELQRKNALSKWLQKQKIKRKYARATRGSKQAAHITQNVVQATGQVVRAIQQYAAAHKPLLAAVALLVMVVLLFAAGMTSCTAMLSGLQSSYLSATYLANEQDICDAGLYYTQMETDLQRDIDNTETTYPGYDEYRYNIGEISHNPYELMGYLSTMFNAFTFDQVQAELARLFGEQYRLTREVITETRYNSDGLPYNWYVLQTTLTVKPLSMIIADSLPAGEETDRYNEYQQTLGRRQAYGSPFDFPWLSYVSSGYGWRVHPVTGAKDLNRGVDIAVAQGTPIKAIHDGRVISAGDAGDYGLCVVIEDGKGYQSRYAHCASLNVTSGQEVKRGDVIAAVGSTGDSTGPHLHLEIMLDGEYLNPYYFVETGSGGEVTGPVIPDYSGEPMESRRFRAMLTEAEKYLGYPYVWGGKSPATSFDCSGYVSWVINHSGWNVGSQGVIGLEDLCTPVSQADAKPGDLVFFIGTYDAPYPDRPTHVGIYVGGGRFIHCGDPISYANLSAPYWVNHLYGFSRLPEP